MDYVLVNWYNQPAATARRNNVRATSLEQTGHFALAFPAMAEQAPARRVARRRHCRKPGRQSVECRLPNDYANPMEQADKRKGRPACIDMRLDSRAGED